MLTQKKQGKLCQYSFYFFDNDIFNKRNPCLKLKTEDLKFSCNFEGHYLATICQRNNQEMTADFKILNLSTLSLLNSPKPCPFPSQLIALDKRYGLAIFPRIFQGNKRTYLYLFNRRSQFIKGFSVPLLLSQLTPNQTNAYELLGVETVKSNYGILIKLNPLNITRIPLEFIPNFMIGEAWGYGLADTTGKLLLLDRNGDYIGKMDLKLEITAITGLNDNRLLIATIENQQAKLLTIHLETM